MTDKPTAPHWIGTEYGPELVRKTDGRIWVHTEADREDVLKIIQQDNKKLILEITSIDESYLWTLIVIK